MATIAVLLAVLSAAPASASPAFEQLLRLSVPQAPPPIGRTVAIPAPACVFDGRTGRPAPLQALLARARTADVVYAGERHDSAAHHRAQASLLAELLAVSPRAAAAFEMLHVTHQPALDSYLAGTTDAAAFRQAVDWPKTWGFPFALYEPLFDLLRGRSRRGAALNVPKRIVTKVSISGLASLTPQERAFVPSGFTRPTDPAYLAMLGEVYRAHGGDPADAGFPNFVDAQALWNEGMADALARFASAAPAAPVLVVAGAYHVYADAIPAGVARRAPGLAQLSVVLLERDGCPASLDPAELELSADFYWIP